MRVYFEKPRTTVGWKGLINDPHLDGTFKINDGLRLARHLLLDLAAMGVPTGTEFLDMISPQYIAGLVCWGAIGARTTESQVHRQLVSGVSCPVGFKNATSGDVQVAVDAVLSASWSHTFLGHTHHGQSAIFVTAGNPDCHIILRGGRKSVNYTAESVAETAALMERAGIAPRIMIDFSHANSGKDYRRQSVVGRDVAAQIASGNRKIIGVMIESNLVAGAQKLVAGQPLSILSTAKASPMAASTGRKPARCSKSSPPRSAPAAARRDQQNKGRRSVVAGHSLLPLLHSFIFSHALPITTVCGLMGIGCSVIPLNPASAYIASSSANVYASPSAVVVSIVIAKAAGMGGDTRSGLGTNSSVAARPPGLSAARTFFSSPTFVGLSKWCRKFVSSTASYGPPNSTSNALPGSIS